VCSEVRASSVGMLKYFLHIPVVESLVSRNNISLPASPQCNHLLILQHGLHGSYSDFDFLGEKLRTRYKDAYFVYAARSNSSSILKTQDGIATAGNRLYAEILEIVSKLPQLNKISFIGHSLGGLIARYVIGKFYEAGFFEKLNPIYFVSIAVPNVGSRRPARSLWNNVVSFVTTSFLQKTGSELMLEDNSSEGVPLLVWMANKDAIFMKGLAMFQKRVLYANVRNDLSVPYCTASIVHKNPYLSGKKVIKLSSKYPHIIEEEGEVEEPIKSEEIQEVAIAPTVDVHNTQLPTGLSSEEIKVAQQHQDEEDEKEMEKELFSNDVKGEHLRFILSALQTLKWKRYDVVFDNWLLSHTHIVMKLSWINSAGMDVIEHITDNLAPQIE